MSSSDFLGCPGDLGWQVCQPNGSMSAGLHGSGADAGDPPSAAQVRRARLVRTIECEIVPRLVLARRAEPVAGSAPPAHGPTDLDVTELTRLLMNHDVSVTSTYVEMVRARGATLEQICLDLMAPAARRLGLLWEQDECDFMQVTVGLCRLHQLLRELGPEFGSTATDAMRSRRILLAPCPGEQHTFGLSLVAQFLRRADWDVWHEFPATDADIIEAVRRNWFAVVGLSVGSESKIDHVTASIEAIRRESRNRDIGVMVGGPILLKKPELACAVGADSMAADGPQAVVRAEQFLAARAHRTP